MVTCRAEAGLRVPLSIPSWLSSNIAELQSTHRHLHSNSSISIRGHLLKHRLLCHCAGYLFYRVPVTCVRVSILDLGHPLRGGSSMGQGRTAKAHSVLQSFTCTIEKGTMGMQAKTLDKQKKFWLSLLVLKPQHF